MFMTTLLTASTSSQLGFGLVFAAGLLSFFSPCILPLIPLYMGYLAGGTQHRDENGAIVYKRSTVLLHTIFFVLGISAAFFLLGAAFTQLGAVLSYYRTWMVRIGGLLIIAFGVWMLLPKKSAALQAEKRFSMPQFKSMNPLVALVMGFLFSFAWTPCVGPILSSILILSANAQSVSTGFIFIVIYTLGFIIPFLLLGLFTSQILNWLKRKSQALAVSVKIAGALLLIIGVLMISGKLTALISPLSSFSGSDISAQHGQSLSDAQSHTLSGNTSDPNTTSAPNTSGTPKDSRPKPSALPFELTDTQGTSHKLSDYAGKTVFINFWATWCPPCKKELPDIEKIYHEYGENQNDVIVLGVTNPKTDSQGQNADVTVPEIKAFVAAHGLHYPILMDTTGDVFAQYRVSAFPTSFVINKEGKIEGYVPGALSYDAIKGVIEQAR